MSLTIGIQSTADGPLVDQVRPDETVVQFDNQENGGYYWHLYPVFVEVAAETGQMIDLYGDAQFEREDIAVLRRALQMARQAVETLPDHWRVHVGVSSMPNAMPPVPPFDVYREVERSRFMTLLDSLLALVDRAALSRATLLCIGD